ncbi:undecaprenyl-diphosphate phosphatase [Novosphingobium pokkalii]|uniref:Undecaprenyl-diphosphatase n=1 Tax=Novosphingobium pokkalii TaxID=1770194 RepID=A0ABV7V7A6_9SPHN|nr:undecaprenyl-diphosphate phosphatase [Novosphingobium pokkalii]GHC91893.1 undecaprenyl-diphosphatase [Novosphingobium pokkalii]
MDSHTITAVILGIVEGLTEFLPVSSTGHLILATELLGFNAKEWEVFNVVIQLPAILAVVVLYWRTFVDVAHGALRGDRDSLHFVRNVLVAFIPSAILGVLLKKKIDALMETPSVVAAALVVGGVLILVIERLARQGEYEPVSKLPLPKALAVGVMQCLAMIPGMSRSASTIMGALTMGINRKTAAEFSFFLAVPTMFGATAKQLWDNRHELASGTASVGWGDIAVGGVVSFLVSLVVIKFFVTYIGRHGFTPFAWYRIVIGAGALVWLLGV